MSKITNMKNDIMLIPYFLVMILSSSSILTGTVFAQTEKDADLCLNKLKNTL